MNADVFAVPAVSFRTIFRVKMNSGINMLRLPADAEFLGLSVDRSGAIIAHWIGTLNAKHIRRRAFKLMTNGERCAARKVLSHVDSIQAPITGMNHLFELRVEEEKE